MNSSDIIALVAVILSAAISVTTSLVSYFVNKSNIQAKRSEIAFERRLEGFREIAEQIGKIKFKLSFINSRSDFDKGRDELKQIEVSAYEVYRKNLVFLTPSISKNIAKYGSLIQDFVYDDDYTDEKSNSCFKEAQKIENEIIDEMQKFIGYT